MSAGRSYARTCRERGRPEVESREVAINPERIGDTMIMMMTIETETETRCDGVGEGETERNAVGV